MERVTARYGLSPYLKQTGFAFKRLNVTKGLHFTVFAQNFVCVTNVKVFYLNFYGVFLNDTAVLYPVNRTDY